VPAGGKVTQHRVLYLLHLDLLATLLLMHCRNSFNRTQDRIRS
jgi:hypothetical protein